MGFMAIASALAIERFFRLVRAFCAYEELCRFHFGGTIACDKKSLGGTEKDNGAGNLQVNCCFR